MARFAVVDLLIKSVVANEQLLISVTDLGVGFPLSISCSIVESHGEVGYGLPLIRPRDDS